MAQNPQGSAARSGSDQVAESETTASDAQGTAPVTDLSAVRRDRQARAAPPSADATTATPKRKTGNRRFDTEKVARLKDDIEAGRYEIDPFSVADRFIEHERNGR